MVDSGTTIYCISKDLIKKAKLFLTNASLEVGLADRTQLLYPLASGKLTFSLVGAAKLTFVDVIVAVLPCQNSCIIDRVSALSTFSAFPDLDKTSFLLNDPTLENSTKDLLFKYPEVFSKLPAPEGIDRPPMHIPFRDETKIVSQKLTGKETVTSPTVAASGSINCT
ncbi:hypothetical protein P9112_013910 [Eukaryota sp. TZLM1-RC]